MVASRVSRYWGIILRLVLLSGVVGGGVAARLVTLNTGESDRNEPRTPVAAVRMTFGVGDGEPRKWDGELVLKSGQDVRVVEDQFRSYDYSDQASETAAAAAGKPTEALPNDRVQGSRAWVCSTRAAALHGPTTEWHVRTETPTPVIVSPSVFLHWWKAPDDKVRVKTNGGEFDLHPHDVSLFEPALFLDGRVLVEALPPTALVAPDHLGEQDFPTLYASRPREDGNSDVWLAWQEYDGQSDSIFVRRRRPDGAWGSVVSLAERVDAFRTALGEDARGRLWAIWSMQVDKNWDLYGRAFDGRVWSELTRLTRRDGADIYHRVVSDAMGRLWIIWQAFVDGQSHICAKFFDGTAWSEAERLSAEVRGNNWWPAVAAGSTGSLAVVWDGYSAHGYDVFLRRFVDGEWERLRKIATTSNFEAHPSVAVDGRQRVWLAWDESGQNWGKDTGFLVSDKASERGTQLHESRSVRVVCLEEDTLHTTAGPLSEVLPDKAFWELPHLEIDGNGNPWLFVRHLIMREPDTPLEGPIDLARWQILATTYDGARWRRPTELPYASGRNDMMPATSVDAHGDIWVAWATDGRTTNGYLPVRHQVRVTNVGKEPTAAKPALAPFVPQDPVPAPLEDDDPIHVERVRSHRIEVRDKVYRVYRGDLHRHTDISVDGCNDGSLLDAYRYAKDVAALDFLGVSDHTNGVIDPYAWWRSQKVADLFQEENFVGLYGYERSVAYPNGHRNVFYPARGAVLTPLMAAERRGWTGAGRLFEDVRRQNGISIPHTTGRWSGTDWRDSDAEVETLVEIFQGMRDTYEYPGAPRPKKLWNEFLDLSKPVPRASSHEKSPSFRGPGFVWKALEKGIKLGFIASSDHISCHVSYAFLIAEDLTPTGLLEAARARRSYAATDTILLDVRHHASDGEHLMGEAFSSETPLRIQARIHGTDVIQQIDVIKNNEFVKTLRPNKVNVTFEVTDDHMTPGESYYYVRVLQRDGDMAWGSPVWVRYPE